MKKIEDSNQVKSISSLPKDYTGKVYIEDSQAIFFLEKGLIHREDGPALIYDDKTKESLFFIHGILKD